MRDAISLTRLQQLNPQRNVRGTFQSFIEECEMTLDITLRIMEPVFRSIQEQNELFRKGRDIAGNIVGTIVTKAKGGQSFHNYGLAVDLCELDPSGKQVNWSFDMGLLDPIAKKYGIEWGGDWQSIKDRPHFQISFGFTWQDLYARYKAGHVDSQGYVLLYNPAT